MGPNAALPSPIRAERAAGAFGCSTWGLRYGGLSRRPAPRVTSRYHDYSGASVDSSPGEHQKTSLRRSSIAPRMLFSVKLNSCKANFCSTGVLAPGGMADRDFRSSPIPHIRGRAMISADANQRIQVSCLSNAPLLDAIRVTRCCFIHL